MITRAVIRSVLMILLILLVVLPVIFLGFATVKQLADEKYSQLERVFIACLNSKTLTADDGSRIFCDVEHTAGQP